MTDDTLVKTEAGGSQRYEESFIDIYCPEGLDTPVTLTVQLSNDLAMKEISFAPLGISIPTAARKPSIKTNAPTQDKILFVVAHDSKKWRAVADQVRAASASGQYKSIFLIADRDDDIRLYRDSLNLPSVSFVKTPTYANATVSDFIWALFNQLGVGRLGFD